MSRLDIWNHEIMKTSSRRNRSVHLFPKPTKSQSYLMLKTLLTSLSLTQTKNLMIIQTMKTPNKWQTPIMIICYLRKRLKNLSIHLIYKVNKPQLITWLWVCSQSNINTAKRQSWSLKNVFKCFMRRKISLTWRYKQNVSNNWDKKWKNALLIQIFRNWKEILRNVLMNKKSRRKIFIKGFINRILTSTRTISNCREIMRKVLMSWLSARFPLKLITIIRNCNVFACCFLLDLEIIWDQTQIPRWTTQKALKNTSKEIRKPTSRSW